MSEDDWQTKQSICAQASGVDFSEVESCFNSDRSTELVNAAHDVGEFAPGPGDFAVGDKHYYGVDYWDKPEAVIRALCDDFGLIAAACSSPTLV